MLYQGCTTTLYPFGYICFMKIFKHLFFLIAVGCFFGGIASFIMGLFELLDDSTFYSEIVTMGVCLGFSFFIGFYLWKNNFFNRNK